MNVDLLVSMFLSFIPISELRGGIPYGYFNHIPLYELIPLCLISNMLAPVFAWTFLATLHKGLYAHFAWYRTSFDRFIERSRKKVQPSVDKYGFWGLMVFVAIPLPMTGAWTGALAAWLLGIPRHKALLSIILGVAIASLIVTLVLLGGSTVGSIFIKRI